MEKAAHILMYTLGMGTLVTATYAALHIVITHSDATPGACGIAFGIGAVAGFVVGLTRKFA